MQKLFNITIFADESCLGNQFEEQANPGGAGGIVEHWERDQWIRRDYWVSGPDTTNNRMALHSAIVGLNLLRKQPCRIQFVSDSQYLIKGMTEWLPKWKARGMRRKGGTIENIDLWKELDRVAGLCTVDWDWVRGHIGHPQNEYANHLATSAAKNATSSGGLIDSGYSAWLTEQRDKYGRFLNYTEFTPPS